MFLFKKGLSLIIIGGFLSITIGFFLFSLVRTLTFSKGGEWLESNK